MSFASDLSRFFDNTVDRENQLVRNVVIALGDSVIEMSPVDTGRFRGNWQHESGEIPDGPIDELDPSGNIAKGKMAISAEGILAGDIEYIANNLPYAIELENGYSDQAPQGMVRVTVTRFRRILNKALKDIR